ncbi:hypothetical protein DERF_012314 [Dermatophagoides farinae]|uniref:PDZ domain-containing protein n=1 Tax=Dermatophagoides farinae TaxID=6954 RepID=A0A922KX59_DERFA|nr:uncharacterized protein LOC124497269 [Dermatophagoides farinae]KAH7637970.1 hypothetical protein HUG17_9074 [Dermatophagoides farinae]KAH9501469.1 hypothetical protein DERF_012314 [Dermatophagoides farinae]
MANKTLFLTINRPSPATEWGFEFIETEHKRLGSILVVQNVASSGPAYEAGILPGDILIGIDNSPITGRPLTYSIAIELLSQRTRNRIELQILRDPKNRVRKLKTYKITNSEAYRPIIMNRGVIPSVAQMDSGIRMPDNNIEQFLNEKAREQWAITKQTYRSIPIIEPKPKVRRDWPTGSYLKYMEGPGWHDPPKHIMVQEGKFKLLNQLGSTEGSPVHRQYNSPINLYSENNLQNSINLGSTGSSISPQPVYKMTTTKPETIDITNSPTYQFLQEERIQQQFRPPTSSYSAFNRTSPDPQQTPYFKTLMHTLNVS